MYHCTRLRYILIIQSNCHPGCHSATSIIIILYLTHRWNYKPSATLPTTPRHPSASDIIIRMGEPRWCNQEKERGSLAWLGNNIKIGPLTDWKF